MVQFQELHGGDLPHVTGKPNPYIATSATENDRQLNLIPKHIQKPSPMMWRIFRAFVTMLTDFFNLMFGSKKLPKPVQQEKRPSQLSIDLTATPLKSFSPYTPNKGDTLVGQMRSQNKTMAIFYGSQTGTAEAFTQRLAREAKRYGIQAKTIDPQNVNFDCLAELQWVENNLAVFIVATHGEGDPPDSSVNLAEWLRVTPEQGGMFLYDLNYAVFGCGNSSFEHFNAFAKLVDRQMELLKANRVCPMGLGDARVQIEDDFANWTNLFWDSVCERFELKTTASAESCLTERQFYLVRCPKGQLFQGEPTSLGSYEVQKPPYAAANPFLATLSEKRELHQAGSRSCLHLELDLTESPLTYEPGDHLAILPENDPKLVSKLAERLNCDLDEPFSLINVDELEAKRNPFPCPTTYRTAFTYYLNIASPPKYDVFRFLANYTDDQEERRSLNLLGSKSKDGVEFYKSWVQKAQRSLLEILEEFPGLHPPADLICEVLPRLQPRYYSISSSPSKHPKQVHLTAALVRYKTEAGRQVTGVCTGFLNRLKIGDKVAIWKRRSNFRLPLHQAVPVVMVGPGTGLAPFRGFLQELEHRRQNGKIGQVLLYFGCRHQYEDFIYEDELKRWNHEGVISKLRLAFSRDQSQKVYVQDLLRQDAALLWSLIDKENAHIYVCGDGAAMAPQVLEALEQIISQQGRMSSEAAKNYVKRLAKQCRYMADVWA